MKKIIIPCKGYDKSCSEICTIPNKERILNCFEVKLSESLLFKTAIYLKLLTKMFAMYDSIIFSKKFYTIHEHVTDSDKYVRFSQNIDSP